MGVNVSQNQGFTLIEVLVSVIVLSGMIMISSMAIRNLLLSWDKLSVPYPKEAITFYRLQTSFSSTMSYVIEYKEFGEVSENNFFFSGKKDECIFMSSSPFYGTAPTVMKIYIEEGELRIAEKQLFGCNYDYKNPLSGEFTTFYSALKDIKNLHFSYKFQGEWVATLERELPEAVSLTITDNKGSEQKYTFIVRSKYYEKLTILQRNAGV